MVTDPRLVIRLMFDPGVADKVNGASLLEEDGVTQALYEADYEYSEWMMETLMLENPFNVDIIFIVTLINEEDVDGSSSGPIAYNYVIGVQPVTISKYNADGSLKVDGIKLSHAAMDEIKRVIRENPYGSIRRVRGREKGTQRVGIGLIHGDVVEILYKQYASVY